jgi:phosphoribosylformylglycinamidine synthase
MKAKIYVTLKKGILDPQGRAIQQSLMTLGFNSVENVRLGKLLEVELKEDDPDKAEVTIQTMCQKLLANPVIEEFRFELDSVSISPSRRGENEETSVT